MKAIWNGAIGFGLVNIPVKIYSATETSKLDLDMLDTSDFSNIRLKRINEISIAGNHPKFLEDYNDLMFKLELPKVSVQGN